MVCRTDWRKAFRVAFLFCVIFKRHWRELGIRGHFITEHLTDSPQQHVFSLFLFPKKVSKLSLLRGCGWGAAALFLIPQSFAHQPKLFFAPFGIGLTVGEMFRVLNTPTGKWILLSLYAGLKSRRPISVWKGPGSPSQFVSEDICLHEEKKKNTSAWLFSFLVEVN